MEIQEIKNPEIKQQIQMAYLHGENENSEAIEKTNEKLRTYLKKALLITVKEDNNLVKIPYGNDGDFIIPVFSDKIELEKGLEYFRLNDMKENKIPAIVKIEDFEKIKKDPNFLGLLINIATVSYIINLEF